MMTFLFAQTIPTGGGHFVIQDAEHIVPLIDALNHEIKHLCPAVARFSSITEIYNYLVLNSATTSPCKKKPCSESESIKILLRKLVQEKNLEQYLIKYEKLSPKKAAEIKKRLEIYIEYDKPRSSNEKTIYPST